MCHREKVRSSFRDLLIEAWPGDSAEDQVLQALGRAALEIMERMENYGDSLCEPSSTDGDF